MNVDPRAVFVSSASATHQDGQFVVVANGEALLTPAGNTVITASLDLAGAIAEELENDGIADVTRPGLYAFFCAQRDFIEPDPERTVEALEELLAHDYLLHPADGLGRRQMQMAAWEPQIALWTHITGREPPFADEGQEPNISRADYAAFHVFLDGLSAVQLCVAMFSANLLKSVSLGMLLAQRAISPAKALQSAAVTPRLLAGESQESLEAEQEQEELWSEFISRLLHYAALGSTSGGV